MENNNLLMQNESSFEDNIEEIDRMVENYVSENPTQEPIKKPSGDVNELEETKIDKTKINETTNLPEYPILSHINPTSIKKLDENTEGNLSQRFGKTGYPLWNDYYNEISYIFDNLDNIKISTFEPLYEMGQDVLRGEEYNVNAVAFMDALTRKLKEIKYKYTSNSVFINASLSIKYEKRELGNENAKKELFVDEQSFNIDDIRLANYLYNSRYKDKIFLSQTNSEKQQPYYAYDSRTPRWHEKKGKRILTEEIIRISTTLARALGFNTRAKKGFSKDRIIEEVITKIMPIPDYTSDHLETFSTAFPQWVQFGDLVYDIYEHKVAKMSPFFKLKHYHSFRIPTGLTEEQINELPSSDELDGYLLNQDFDENLNPKGDNNIENFKEEIQNLFVDVPLKMEDVEKGCKLFMDRMKENTKDIELIMSAIGNMFHHSTHWLINLFIIGNGGGGKSFIYNLLQDYMFKENASSIQQKHFDESSRFIENAIESKEFNLMGEVKGVTMSKSFINFFKSTLSDNSTIEEKGGGFRSLYFYLGVIGLSNKGQMPFIPTDDVNDEGLKRRLVVMECDGGGKGLSKKYNKNDLVECIPSFALACMMKFNHHLSNGDIATFQEEIFGCTERPIKGFTTDAIVRTTKNYFKKHDRYRKFFCHLADEFEMEQEHNAKHSGYNVSSLKIFENWLFNKTITQIKDYYKNWYEEQFPTKTSPQKIIEHLETTYGITEKQSSTRTSLPNEKSKSTRTLGQEFVDLVVSINIEDNPSFYENHKKEIEERKQNENK